MNDKNSLTQQQRNDIALAAIGQLCGIYREDSNAILSHDDKSTTAHPEAAFVSIVSQILSLFNQKPKHMPKSKPSPDAPREAGEHFTAGPWHVEPCQWDQGASLVICKAGKGIVAKIEQDDENDFTPEEDAANAALLAAAPELLEKLDYLTRFPLAMSNDGFAREVAALMQKARTPYDISYRQQDQEEHDTRGDAAGDITPASTGEI